jgi:hypothetical protein
VRRTQSLVLAGVVAVWVGVTQGHAFAHPQIDEARARIEAAEFEAALRLLAEAEAGTELSRRDAADLLELRALVYLALHDRTHALRALQMLLVMEPDHHFAAATTPDLIAAFEAARTSGTAAPELVLEQAVRPDGVRFSARVQGDTLGMVRAVRLWTRVGDGAWRSTLADETVIAASPGQSLQYRAVAEGIGGAPVRQTEVRTLVVPEAAAESHRTWLYAGVIAGALAVGGVITAVVLLGRSSSETQPSAPQLVGR